MQADRSCGIHDAVLGSIYWESVLHQYLDVFPESQEPSHVSAITNFWRRRKPGHGAGMRGCVQATLQEDTAKV